MITGTNATGELLPDGAASPDASSVEEVLRALGSTLRSFRLYEGSNPMVDRFLGTLRQKMAALWSEMPYLRLRIEEDRILWEDRTVYPTAEGGAAADLPFVFYKDGIRELTILPGFEETEVLSLFSVLSRAPAIQDEQDDLITLLWQEDLCHLRYRTVEASSEGIELHSGSPGSLEPLDPRVVREQETLPRAVTTEDFQEALYFLEESELRLLQDEVRRETERDLWRDVLNALLDRLEDGGPERQSRIVGILGELLPATLASGQFERAASLLEELGALGKTSGLVTAPALRDTGALFDLLGSEQTIDQLASLLEDAPDAVLDGSMPRLLAFFPPRALAPLMRVVERTQRPAVRRVLEACVQRLAETGREELLELLRGDDATIVASALQWVGRLKLGAALKEVVRHTRHPVPEVRVAALDSLVAIGAGSSGSTILGLLEDQEREVRIAAARALGALAFTPGRQAMEAVLASRRLREGDRTEKLAFFEAYGRLAGGEGVPVLDRLLNARSWIGRGESPELRACAALGLGRIRHPAAREALEAAAADKDPVVRSAVARALRGEPA